VRIDRAIDRYLGDLARQGCSPRTLADYRAKLTPLCGSREVVEPRDVREVTADDCRQHLDRWNERKPGTMYHSWAVLSGFFKWLYRAELIDLNPMARIEPPKRHASVDLEVTSVNGADVRLLFEACRTWGDLLCIATLAYLGPRRGAVSKLHWRDVDLERGTMRFKEKGGKVIAKPIPDEFAALLRAAVASGELDTSASAYVVPMQRKQAHARERDDRVIWRIVKNLGKRAGVEVHPHSLRAAFAVQFLETHPGELEALQRLMGHAKIETTQIYLRRLDQERAMERVKDLSWGTRFGAIAVEAPSGFEPLYEALQASA
jgi:integrase/recombinase XerD